MPSIEDFDYIKAYYTGKGENDYTLGKIIFDVPEDANELPWKYNTAGNYIVDGNKTPIYNNASGVEGRIAKYNHPTTDSGYFYFIKIKDKYIADRPIVLYATFNELNNSGYINSRKFTILTYDEYLEYISIYPYSELWNNMPSYNSYGNYRGGYGEWTNTIRSSDDKVAVVSNVKRETNGEIIATGDYYYPQTAYVWNDKDTRAPLVSGVGTYFMPTAFRPVFTPPYNLLLNNFDLVDDINA